MPAPTQWTILLAGANQKTSGHGRAMVHDVVSGVLCGCHCFTNFSCTDNV